MFPPSNKWPNRGKSKTKIAYTKWKFCLSCLCYVNVPVKSITCPSCMTGKLSVNYAEIRKGVNNANKVEDGVG